MVSFRYYWPGKKNAILLVRPSVRPFVSTLSFEPTDLWTCTCVCVCVWGGVMSYDYSLPGIEGQGQGVRVGAVGVTSILDRWQYF